MRTNFFSLVLLSCIAVLASCEHHGGLYDPDSQKKLTDLVVPQDFDWNGSEDVAVTISAPVETVVTIFADKEGKQALAKVPVSTEPTTYNLSVDAHADQIFIEYPTKNGGKALKAYTLLRTRGAESMIKLPEDTGEYAYDERDGQYYVRYPVSGWGTLLFEDMWPVLGDYDFNDLAAWYKIELKDLEDEGSDQSFWLIDMGIRLNALGGTFPYHLCLQIDDLASSYIEEIECYKADNSDWLDNDHVCTFDSEGQTGPAIFSFDWKNKKGKGDAQFYNTEQSFRVDPSEFNGDQLRLIISLKEPVKLSQITHTSFNFFLKRNDGTEIHLRGYKPTAAFQQRYDEIVASNDNLSKAIPYTTTDNFVWGIKVPYGIDHAVENIDFTQAYTQFRAWIESGGVKSAEWWEEKNSQNCISVN